MFLLGFYEWEAIRLFDTWLASSWVAGTLLHSSSYKELSHGIALSIW